MCMFMSHEENPQHTHDAAVADKSSENMTNFDHLGMTLTKT